VGRLLQVRRNAVNQIRKLLVLRGLRVEREAWEAIPEHQLRASLEWREGYIEGLAVAESIVLNGGKRRYGV
jgi:uncharacterized protein with beta-barrel porin domain